jgi:hypothetical protein
VILYSRVFVSVTVSPRDSKGARNPAPHNGASFADGT